MTQKSTIQALLRKAKLLACALPALATLWATSATATDALHYYDGGEQRSITWQADLLAEFSRGSDQRSVQALVPGAVRVAGVGDSLVRIFRVTNTATRSLNPAPPAAGSWVYREGDSPSGRLMALPGGVLVKFKPEWSRQQVDSWVASRSLAIERPLAIGVNWFLLASPAGDASLALANSIFESGEVLAATPNWWKQTVAR